MRFSSMNEMRGD